MSHSPTPWMQYELGPTIYGPDGYIGVTQSKNKTDDAALIVAAVNGYYSSQSEIARLREAATAAVEQLSNSNPELELADPKRFHGQVAEALFLLRQALSENGHG